MLTVTETITRPLDTMESLALDPSEVFAEYSSARVAGDKKTAVECAKIMMLQAMSMGRWVFHNPVENLKSQKVKNLTFLVFWKTKKSQKLKF